MSAKPATGAGHMPMMRNSPHVPRPGDCGGLARNTVLSPGSAGQTSFTAITPAVLVMVGDGVADLADSRPDLGAGDVLGRGQLPESGHALRGGVTLAQQDTPALPYHQQSAAQTERFGLAQFHRQLRGGAFLARPAAGGERADQAQRIALEPAPI